MSEKAVISKMVGGLREESEVIVGGKHPEGLRNLTDFPNDQNHPKPQT